MTISDKIQQDKTNSDTTKPSSAKPEKPKAKITSIKINTKELSIAKGDKITLSAEVEGVNLTDADKELVWAIVGDHNDDTKVNEITGELEIGKNEKSESITVVAASKIDSTIKSEVTLKIKFVSGVVISGDDSVEKGKTVQLTVTVEGKNLEEADKAVEWKLDTSVEGVTVSENGLITVNAGVSADKVVVKAISKFDISMVSSKEVVIKEPLKPAPKINRDSTIQYMSFTSDDDEWLKAIKGGKISVPRWHDVNLKYDTSTSQKF